MGEKQQKKENFKVKSLNILITASLWEYYLISGTSTQLPGHYYEVVIILIVDTPEWGTPEWYIVSCAQLCMF